MWVSFPEGGGGEKARSPQVRRLVLMVFRVVPADLRQRVGPGGGGVRERGRGQVVTSASCRLQQPDGGQPVHGDGVPGPAAQREEAAPHREHRGTRDPQLGAGAVARYHLGITSVSPRYHLGITSVPFDPDLL